MTSDTYWTSIPRARRSVVIKRDDLERNSFIRTSRCYSSCTDGMIDDSLQKVFEFARVHLLSQPVDLPSGGTENDGLRDTQGVEFPFLLFDRYVKRLDTVKSQLVSLDKNSDWVTWDLQHIIRHGGRSWNTS